MAAPLVIVAVLGQILLPGLAASRARARVERYGTVHSVEVSAFPAWRLLWGSAGSVTVHAGTLTVTPQQIASLLWEARSISTLTVTAEAAVLRVPMLPQGLRVSDVRLEKRGDGLQASATMTQAQLDASLPSGFSVEPTGSGEGAVEARASGGLFGVQASLTALVRPVEGALVAEPRGLPFGGLARVTLFSDPHLKVLAVGVRPSGSPATYALSVRASLG